MVSVVDQNALLRSVVGPGPSDDLLASALRRSGGDLAAAVNIVLDAPKTILPPPQPVFSENLSVCEIIDSDDTAPPQVAQDTAKQEQIAIGSSQASDQKKILNLVDTTSGNKVPKKSSSKRTKAPVAQPSKCSRLNERATGLLPQLRDIVGHNRSDDFLMMALRRSGGDLAAAVNIVFDGSLSHLPIASIKTEPLDAKVKEELAMEDSVACSDIENEITGVQSASCSSSWHVKHELPASPAEPLDAEGSGGVSGSKSWVLPSSDWSFKLASIRVKAFSTRQLRSNETFTAEDGSVGPLLRSGARIELRWAATQKRTKGSGKGKRNADSNSSMSIKIYTSDVEVGRLPTDIAKMLVPLLTREVVEVIARVGAPAPTHLILGTDIPIDLEISLRGAVLCSPHEVGETEQKQLDGIESADDECEPPKKRAKEQGAVVELPSKAKAKPNKLDLEIEEADREAKTAALSQLFRHIGLPCRGFNVLPDSPSHGAQGESSCNDNSICSAVADKGVSDLGLADESAEAEEETEACDDMSREVGAQLGGRQALERADLPTVILPESHFLARLRHYQAQAVLWMWRRENPLAELPEGWCEAGSEAAAQRAQKESIESNDQKTLHPSWDEYELRQPIGASEGLQIEASHIYHHRTTGALSLIFPDASLALCRGGVLADDMGLGKTVMCLALLSLDVAPGVPNAWTAAQKFLGMEKTAQTVPKSKTFFRSSRSSGDQMERTQTFVGGTLVVVPLSLISQWNAESQRHFPSKLTPRVHEYHGAGRRCTAQQLMAHDIVITTYGTLGLETENGALFQVFWRRIILDEAHNIKNRNSRMARAAFRLRAYARWCVTGTPLQNSVDELYSLVKFLRIDPWSSLAAWRKAISIPLEQGSRGDVEAMSRALRTASRIVQPILMRRTKMSTDPRTGELLLKLPPKHVHILEVQLSEPEREFYDALYTRSVTQFDSLVSHGQALSKYTHILQLITKLRQSLCHPFLVFARDAVADNDFASLEKRCLSEMVGGSVPRAFVENLLDEVRDGKLADCPICVDTPQDPAMTPCGHIFCRECALKASKTWKGECPVCRKPGALERKALKMLPGASRFPSQLLAATNKEGGEGKVQGQSTKMKELLFYLREDIAEGRRAVIFTQFTSFMDLIGPALDAENIPYQRFDGSLSREERQKRVAWLSEESERPGRALLVSLRAGGVGLNLVAASRLYMLDLWWNPAVEEQAIMRVHRIGQTQEVHVFKFVVHDSIDTDLLELQKAKSRLLEDAIEGDCSKSQTAAKLTLDDLKRLFNPCRSVKKQRSSNDDITEVHSVDPSLIGIVNEAAPILEVPTTTSAVSSAQGSTHLVPSRKIADSAPPQQAPVQSASALLPWQAPFLEAEDAMPMRAELQTSQQEAELELDELIRHGIETQQDEQVDDGIADDSDGDLSDEDLLAACHNIETQMAFGTLSSQAVAPTDERGISDSETIRKTPDSGLQSLALVEVCATPVRASTPTFPITSVDPMCKCDAPQPATLLTVRKEGPNVGRQFYKCSECNFFQWADAASKNSIEKPEVQIEQESGMGDIPMCRCEPPQQATLLTVRKEGPNTGRQFYKCGDCNFFQWADASGNAGISRGISSASARSDQLPGNESDVMAPGNDATSTRSCFKCGQNGHWAQECPNNSGSRRGNTNNSGGACFKCGKSGHWARDCLEGAARNGGGGGSASCFKCGRPGHYASDCKFQSKVGGY